MIRNTYYISPKPLLTIEGQGTKNLGRCYTASYFKVTSRYPLSLESLKQLRAAGFLGYGQEFICRHVSKDGTKEKVPDTLDWRTTKDVVPTGTDVVGGTIIEEADTWEARKIIGTSTDGTTSSIPFYVYECESRVDSSD